ncbi:MAG: DNA replication complex GINS family protein [Crenarchaeota archaeon]|nr:DNA replication complex GINS family protein [Thermoproteota archaeon]
MIRELVDVYINSGIVRIEVENDTVHTMIPLLAERAIREGAKLGETSRIGPEKLVELCWVERRYSDVRQIPRDIYVRARLLMIEAQKRDDTKTVRDVQHNLRELIQLRLRKILNVIAVNPDLAISREFLDKLAVEEEVLVRKLVSLIKDWIMYVLGL